MIVAVLAVLVMQMSIDEIVRVIPVRHRCVTTRRAVDVIGGVFGRVIWRATRRVLRVDGNGALVDVTVVRAVQVAIVQVIGVVTVLDRLVATARAMNVVVVVVLRMVRHGSPQ